MEKVERPVISETTGLWGSDLIAEMLRALDVEYVALNPGSSFRGLHDSLVNHLGNENPQMLLCLHEEHTVAIAHGWAKVTGRPMAAIVHANVGLMHATMSIYNAWCDRVPVMVFGATGPVDATERRPWIDWIHTSRDQAAIVRPYVKWDDQPASLSASLEAMIRGALIAKTAPMAPVYICFDVVVQEEAVTAPIKTPDPRRFKLPMSQGLLPDALAELHTRLKESRSPVFLMGRVSRSADDWAYRVALAEHFNARVLTDIKLGAAFPTDHSLHSGTPGFFLSPDGAKVLNEADLIVSFDWVDVAGTLKQAGAQAENAPLVQLSVDHQLHNGWSLDHQAAVRADLHIAAEPDIVIRTLCKEVGLTPQLKPQNLPAFSTGKLTDDLGPMDVDTLAAALGDGLKNEVVSLVRLPLSWGGDLWHFRHPLDYLGYDGGAGIASGPGMLVGAALALKGTDRLPVAVLGDGDYLMGVSAFWTAARYGIPFLAIIANNRSFYNDEIHQEKVAVSRERPVENKWIGQHIGGPDIDLAAMARAQGVKAIGPVTNARDLKSAIEVALEDVRQGNAVVIDARITPGYSKAMSAGMTRTADETAE
ncbi:MULTISPECIES: thiamine pyrophosphate-binding protein [Thalassospira]|jgi:thiamine pyrophosphate-dependent acetolactate synthase large subunit-like protein|uniref:Acetolactate synthase n=1 Tax=Thalassospira xiamenensis TaxID=220697 RepID=A0ABR5XYV5_9PROT|nr:MULTISPECIES: thiamine pyrophosphate-binding protein [Thalassospira]MBA05804.1 acetolactate synthase [Thalassospira sp.]KZD01700.1 acetolactate synthase [Thalassospira xiamenensis]KZD11185.1 acetolactate synthase [Thalassospira xiamenensis]MBL4843824.1 thiamine pyrophosphate-binding protein [Thalassospira sp.]MCD1592436.1 thiamine pyrophosphate-binding protein [Thalassospira xiamenensis]|tara:strand:- start:3896 stop:5671 length:1776 start_codon:yes stop_codon:yes gene_type:complete